MGLRLWAFCRTVGWMWRSSVHKNFTIWCTVILYMHPEMTQLMKTHLSSWIKVGYTPLVSGLNSTRITHRHVCSHTQTLLLFWALFLDLVCRTQFRVSREHFRIENPCWICKRLGFCHGDKTRLLTNLSLLYFAYDGLGEILGIKLDICLAFWSCIFIYGGMVA